MSAETLNYPVDRFGRIISANRQISMEESKSVARDIKNRGYKFFAAMENCFKSHGIKKPERQSEDIHEDKSGIPILYFPSFDLKYNSYKFRVKTSLTVCMYGRKSKIWSRISLLRVNGKNAYNLPPKVVNKFFDDVECFSIDLTSSILKEYKDTILDLNVAKDLKTCYLFRFRGMNDSNINLAGLLKRISDGNISGLEEILGYSKHLFSLGTLFSLSTGDYDDYSGTVKKLARKEYYNVSLFKSDIKRSKLNSIFTAYNKPEITNVDSLCFNESEEIGKATPADYATQGLLELYAERY